MNIQHYISQLQAFYPLGMEEQEALKIRVKELRLSKGSILLYNNEICKSLYYVIEGFFRSYQLDFDQEITVNFASKGDVVTSVDSFIYQVPSQEVIVCESDAIVIQSTYYDLLALQDISPNFIRVYSLYLQDNFLKSRKEYQLLRNANASQKYQYLCKKYPGIATIVSYKNIASYLGITPPTLSNIIKESF